MSRLVVVFLKGVDSMNRVHHFLVLGCLCSVGIVLADVVPYISMRSQGFNAARELVGWQTQINRPCAECMYGSFSITPEYTRTFKPHQIAEFLFCDALASDCSDTRTATFLVQGSQVANRNRKALMAENFYLPTDFSSEITIEPRIDNILVDFNFYLGLDEWLNGLYFRIHTPICHTRWDMGYCENVVAKGILNYEPGYFNGTFGGTNPNEYGILRANLLNSFEEYIVDGRTISGVSDVTFNALERAKISKCRLTKTRPAEIAAALGWNFYNCEDFMFGINLRAAAPTGNRPEGCYLFEPIVGQGHHWELGGGIDSRWTLWRACDECDDLTLYLDANVTHLFKTRQCRTFDLACKPLSRYMLAMKMTGSVQNLLVQPDPAVATFVSPEAQFAKEYMPVANLTTIPVDVSAAVQGEIVLKAAYTHGNFQFDLGYDFWARSCEKITRRGDCCSNNFKENTWALKGDAFTFGFREDQVTHVLINQSVALSATESKATVFGGTNMIANATQWNRNVGIDNGFPASTANGAEFLFTKRAGSTLPDQVQTSFEPIFIKESDFDINAARTSALSNKVFAHFGYIWQDRCDWVPYLGVGAEVEFGHRDNRCCTRSSVCAPDSCNNTNTTVNTSCNKNNCNTSCKNNSCCKSVSVSQWGVWVKGGVSFE